MKKILVLLGFLTLTCTLNAQIFSNKRSRQKVSAIVGNLTLHPDSVTIKGTDKKNYYFFLDTKNECLFITDNEDIYKTFSSFLPKVQISGREIEVEGTSISPFTLFSKEQLKEEGKKKIGLELNSFSLYKIFNYGLKEGTVIKYNSPRN